MGLVAERRVGSVIGGKWRVDSLLGSGSMAAVYAVTHRNGARAALKILHPTLCADPAVCERFLGEGYLTNAVKHPAVVRVLDDGVTDDGCVFLLMDLLEGMTLEALRLERGGRLELDEALDVADKLMDALEAVHDAGVIHRDLKPQNVFVCDDGDVKLLDFGVARLFDGASGKLSIFGVVLGTPSFMSPEQARGSRELVDHRSDIWSLGATLFTAITGETVHLGPHTQAKILAAATVKPRSISMVMPDLPPPIAGAIDTALRFEPDDRWEDIRAFRRALRDARTRALAGGRGAEDAPGANGAPPPSEPRPAPPSYATPAPALPQRIEPRARLSTQVGARRSTIGSWLVGLAVAASAVGGVAWLAVERGRGRVAEVAEAVDAEPQLTSATLPSPSALPPAASIPTVSIDSLDRLREAAVTTESPRMASVKPASRVLPRPEPRIPWRPPAPPAPAESPPERPAPAPLPAGSPAPLPAGSPAPLPAGSPAPLPAGSPAPLPAKGEEEEPPPSARAPDPFGTPD